jgi:hypothetical protein
LSRAKKDEIMRWSLKLGWLAVGVLALALVGPALTQEAPPGLVQIDLNKLPPDVAKRLLDELAKQQQPAIADKGDREKPGAEKMDRAKAGEKDRRRPAGDPARGKAKAGEKPSKGKPDAKRPEPGKQPEKK